MLIICQFKNNYYMHLGPDEFQINAEQVITFSMICSENDRLR